MKKVMNLEFWHYTEFDLAVTAIIETIATARTNAAIVPNSELHRYQLLRSFQFLLGT